MEMDGGGCKLKWVKVEMSWIKMDGAGLEVGARFNNPHSQGMSSGIFFEEKKM